MNHPLWLDPHFITRLSLTLLHSLWQTALLALFGWSLERLWRRRSAQRSYLFYVAALIAALIAIPITYARVNLPLSDASRRDAIAAIPRVDASPRPVEVAAPANVVPAEPLVTHRPIAAALPADATSNSFTTSQTAATWFIGLYALGVLVMLVRLGIGLWCVHRLVAAVGASHAGPVADLLASLARQWSMVAPALAVAERIVVPKVVGVVRPTILLPASAVTGLSMDELQMILTHELAHIRRYDLWVNLLQRLAETFLFFNPGLWYLSRRTSTLREFCCDDLTCRAALSQTAPDPRSRYAVTLLKLAELSCLRRTGERNTTMKLGELATLSAAGRSPSELRRRVTRLFDEPVREPLQLSWSSILVLGALTVLIAWSSALAPSKAQTADAAAKTEKHSESPQVKAPQTEPIKRLTFRGNVEILAIGTQGKEPQRWWDAAGKLKDSVPRRLSRGPSVQASATDAARRIAFQITSVPDDAEITSRVVGSHASAGTTLNVDPADRSSHPFMSAFTVPKDRGTFELKVGVAAGPWKTVAQAKGSGGFATGFPDRKGVVFSKAIDTDRGTTIVISHNFFDENFRVVAIDRQGKTHDSAGRGGFSGGPVYQTDATFPNLSPDKISRFEFQTRKYAWVTIAGLPLQPQAAAPKPSDKSSPDAKPGAAATKKAGAVAETGQKSKPVDLNVVIARHVILLEGREIVTWDQLEKKLEALRNRSAIHPHFYVTRGATQGEMDKDKKTQDKIWQLRRTRAFTSFSYGSLLPRADFRYDAIAKPDDLVPDPKLRIEGTVVDQQGKPVPGAEVVLIASVDKSLEYKAYDIAIVKGRIRNPLEEVITQSSPTGAFAIVPHQHSFFVAPAKAPSYYVLALHPEHGFALTPDSQFLKDRRVTLLAWGGLNSRFSQEAEKQTANLSTHIAESNGRPEVTLSQYWSDRKQTEPTLDFAFRHVPPIYNTTIMRSFSGAQGSSFSLPGASVSLLPGETRRVDLGELSEQQRQQLNFFRERSEQRRKPSG